MSREDCQGSPWLCRGSRCDPLQFELDQEVGASSWGSALAKALTKAMHGWLLQGTGPARWEDNEQSPAPARREGRIPRDAPSAGATGRVGDSDLGATHCHGPPLRRRSVKDWSRPPRGRFARPCWTAWMRHPQGGLAVADIARLLQCTVVRTLRRLLWRLLQRLLRRRLLVRLLQDFVAQCPPDIAAALAAALADIAPSFGL